MSNTPITSNHLAVKLAEANELADLANLVHSDSSMVKAYNDRRKIQLAEQTRSELALLALGTKGAVKELGYPEHKPWKRYNEILRTGQVHGAPEHTVVLGVLEYNSERPAMHEADGKDRDGNTHFTPRGSYGTGVLCLLEDTGFIWSISGKLEIKDGLDQVPLPESSYHTWKFKPKKETVKTGLITRVRAAKYIPLDQATLMPAEKYQAILDHLSNQITLTHERLVKQNQELRESIQKTALPKI